MHTESESAEGASRHQFSLRSMFSWTTMLGILIAVPTMAYVFVWLSFYVLVGLSVVVCLLLLQLPGYLLLKSHFSNAELGKRSAE